MDLPIPSVRKGPVLFSRPGGLQLGRCRSMMNWKAKASHLLLLEVCPAVGRVYCLFRQSSCLAWGWCREWVQDAFPSMCSWPVNARTLPLADVTLEIWLRPFWWAEHRSRRLNTLCDGGADQGCDTWRQ